MNLLETTNFTQSMKNLLPKIEYRWKKGAPILPSAVSHCYVYHDLWQYKTGPIKKKIREVFSIV